MDCFQKAFLPLMLPMIIIVGLRGGIFTPTEAGVVAAIYATLVSIFVPLFKLENVARSFSRNTIKTTSMVMFTAAAAMISGFAITVLQSC